nr:DEAD/DEAH box helicase [Rappaport israeli]
MATPPQPPIQAQAIPFALEGRDLLLSAQTGSGKTAAFVLPMLDRIIREDNRTAKPRVLILTPTRELALQVNDSVRRYAGGIKWLYSVPLVGGAPYGGQIRALKKGVHIIIATPGRLLDHMRDNRIDFSQLHTLILDEADRMLDMGFSEDINAIIKASPKNRQTILCSATWDGPVAKLPPATPKIPNASPSKSKAPILMRAYTTATTSAIKTTY